jgi:hypothetical protein
MAVSRTLIGTLTNKAKASFGKEVTKENFEDWRQHWIKTRFDWANELRKEGLPKSADHVQQLAEFEKQRRPTVFSS